MLLKRKKKKKSLLISKLRDIDLIKLRGWEQRGNSCRNILGYLSLKRNQKRNTIT